MSGNTESTANSTKFAPMPMSALLANLMSVQKSLDSPDSSFTSADESDNSFSEIAAMETSPLKVINGFRTPNARVTQVNKDTKGYSSERKMTSKVHDKENINRNTILPNQLSLNKQSAHKNVLSSVQPTSEVKNHALLKTHKSNKILQGKIGSVHTSTQEMSKLPVSSQKKTATPKIKSGIRKFTPGSGKHSHKKSPLKILTENRDRVRCELFSQNPSKSEISYPVPQVKPIPTPILTQMPTSTPTPLPTPTPTQRPTPTPTPTSVPETPVNRRPMPASYVATPSYPQGAMGNNSKILYKTTSIKDKKYLFIKKLGTGGSSEVYKVLEVGSSCEYAVKCVYLATDRELAQGYINEVRLLRELQNSDRVVRLYDYEYDRANQFLRLVLEVGETDLSSFLRARGAGLPPALVLHYWEEMLHAVHYIHEHGVIHADLKPANFLLVCGRLKLIDFGIASAISSDATSVVRAQATGTYSYISPEALMGGAGGYGVCAADGNAPIKISFRSDVWSLGCILYSMVYGRTPFGHIPNLAKLAAILDPNHKIDFPPVERLPPALMAALRWCLIYVARSRPSVSQLLALPYLQPTKSHLPETLLNKLRPHLSQQEYQLLQRAQI